MNASLDRAQADGGRLRWLSWRAGRFCGAGCATPRYWRIHLMRDFSSDRGLRRIPSLAIGSHTAGIACSKLRYGPSVGVRSARSRRRATGARDAGVEGPPDPPGRRKPPLLHTPLSVSPRCREPLRLPPLRQSEPHRPMLRRDSAALHDDGDPRKTARDVVFKALKAFVMDPIARTSLEKAADNYPGLKPRGGAPRQ